MRSITRLLVVAVVLSAVFDWFVTGAYQALID
jgi:hypothetical protein